MNVLQGPPGQKGDQGATEIIDYNGNIHEALQVCDQKIYTVAGIMICLSVVELNE